MPADDLANEVATDEDEYDKGDKCNNEEQKDCYWINGPNHENTSLACIRAIRGKETRLYSLLYVSLGDRSNHDLPYPSGIAILERS